MKNIKVIALLMPVIAYAQDGVVKALSSVFTFLMLVGIFFGIKLIISLFKSKKDEE
jgi:hypothetical protein